MKRFLAALTCCALLTLCSCSDDSSSSADPPSPTPTSASSEPSPTQEVETPEEFVARWIDLNTSMQNTGDTKAFRRVSSKCRPCLSTADQVDSIYKAGGYVKTDGWTAKSIAASEPGTDGAVQLTIAVISAPTEYKESSDGQIQRLEGGDFRELMSIAPNGNSWIVTNLEQLAE